MSEKMVKSPKSFFKATTSASLVIIFSLRFGKIVFTLARTFLRSVLIDYLITLSLEKEIRN